MAGGGKGIEWVSLSLSGIEKGASATLSTERGGGGKGKSVWGKMTICFRKVESYLIRSRATKGSKKRVLPSFSCEEGEGKWWAKKPQEEGKGRPFNQLSGGRGRGCNG